MIHGLSIRHFRVLRMPFGVLLAGSNVFTSHSINARPPTPKPVVSVPALSAGWVPPLQFERKRVVAPALSRQSRLDVDQGIEKLGPELNPVPFAHSASASGNATAGPVLGGVEETVAKLDAATRASSGSAKDGQSAASARRADEVRIIPDETKQREQFRAVSTFFDPPTIKNPSSAQPATSSATYEQK